MAGVVEVAVGDGGEEANAGVVDEDVDGVVLLDGTPHERFDGEAVCDVDGDDGCRFADVRGDRL